MTPPEPPKRRFYFLQLAGLFLFFALLDYVVLDQMDYVGSNEILTALFTVLTLILMLLVAATLLMVMCFSNARLGAAITRRFQYLRDAWAVPFRHLGLFGVRVESGMDEKKQATRRKQQRHQRRRYRQHPEKNGS
ncbi:MULTISPECIES: hypothetical protein [unclassified Iodidimonas]|jgi:hypothetical protein|uniref:hypothetical protein n=1 Tax=unclassified Iodidimonas TaxID=2626145 RepID=UPI002482F91E|nr:MULTISPECIES: hypothetical protein [unclassified Iodidimonas]